MIEVFAGKGGVGKTTCAAASALHHATLGERTLAISTDAAPSLSHIFGVASAERPAKVQDSLYIDEIGLEQVKEMWDEKFGKEVYEVFSSFVSIDYQDFLEFMTSLLPGLAEEFMVYYIRELVHRGEYETVIWDTAPLGQTLALLRAPAMLVEHLRTAPRIYSRLKRGRENKEPLLDIIKRWRELSEENLRFLQGEIDFSMVTIPEALAVKQLEDVFGQLNRSGFKVTQLIINNVVKSPDSDFLLRKSEDQEKHIKFLHQTFRTIRIVELPLFSHEVIGLDRLKEVERIVFLSGARS
jgi:arsenite-transporting ATPase